MTIKKLYVFLFFFVSLQPKTKKIMKLLKDKRFGGERPLFAIRDTRLENVTITEGESGIKCCQNIAAEHSNSVGK